MSASALVLNFLSTRKGRRPAGGYSLRDIDEYVADNSHWTAVTTRTALQRLLDKGQVSRPKRGYYLAE